MQDRPAALITGGSKRVGAAIARRLVEAGFDIAITYLSGQAEAADLCQEIETKGAKAIAISADLRAPEQSVPPVAAEILKRFGRLDLLVNNASIYRPTNLANTDAAAMTEMMKIHFLTPLLLARAFEKTLRANHGLIVNMLDATAEKPGGKYLAYTASKAALANLTLALARELAPEVRVNGIAPGVVDWPSDFPDEQRKDYLQRVPLRREGTPQDVAELVTYLATMGKYITGQIVKLDGGRSIV